MYGEHHKSTLTTHFYLANVYSRQSRLPEAEAHQLAALEPLAKQLPPLSSEVLDARWDPALIWLQQGKREASRALAMEIVAAAEEARGMSRYLQSSDFAAQLRERWEGWEDGRSVGEGGGL
ncbi:hypothetical protein G7Y79_00010g028580 [Physcia stellaris]|nr:hypothetical protein G7Y79_00010g028580 [Physcia stellaris]